MYVGYLYKNFICPRGTIMRHLRAALKIKQTPNTFKKYEWSLIISSFTNTILIYCKLHFIGYHPTSSLKPAQSHWKCRFYFIYTVYIYLYILLFVTFGLFPPDFFTWMMPPRPPSSLPRLCFAKLAISHLPRVKQSCSSPVGALSHFGTRSAWQPPIYCFEPLESIPDLQSFPGVAVFMRGGAAFRLYGHPNPHKRPNQTTPGWSDQQDPQIKTD